MKGVNVPLYIDDKDARRNKIIQLTRQLMQLIRGNISPTDWFRYNLAKADFYRSGNHHEVVEILSKYY